MLHLLLVVAVFFLLGGEKLLGFMKKKRTPFSPTAKKQRDDTVMWAMIIGGLALYLYQNYDRLRETFHVHVPVCKYTPQGFNQPDYEIHPPQTRTKPYGMFLFENTVFKPECCPFSSYSSSRGCPCDLPRNFYSR